MFFLTQVDTERLNIRGSRDPLGLVPLWGSFGRKVVGNLTTASTSVRGFTTLILGFHFADRVAPSGKEREATRLATFLKFEQLAGYARQLRNNDGATRGITEIKRRIEEDGTRRIPIGAANERQILGNQKTYGLWGLYSVPAVESGFLERRELTLTPAARTLVEGQYIPVFESFGLGDGKVIEDLLRRDSVDLDADGKHKKVFDAVGRIMEPISRAAERAVYHQHLVVGGLDGGRSRWQARFAELVESDLPGNSPLDMAALIQLIRSANKRAEDAPLGHHLQRIRELEAVLTAMANLFAFLQDRESAKLADVVSELSRAWRGGLKHVDPAAIEALEGDISAVYGGDTPTGKRFGQLAGALRSGDYADAISQVLDHNRFVMDTRHRAQPWIRIVDGKFDVRYRDRIAARLESPAELASAWRSTFYLDPLKVISDELRQAA